MNNNLKFELVSELKSFRSGAIDASSFREWIVVNYKDLEPLISPGLLIKLKRGSEPQMRATVASLLPSCPNCRDICEEGSFLTREEYVTCTSKVTEAVRTGSLAPVGRPSWFNPEDKHFGADGYYKCNICEAMWTLVNPEREDNGLWERVA